MAYTPGTDVSSVSSTTIHPRWSSAIPASANPAVFGTVESLKTVSSLYMPVAGEVVERNEALEGKPTLVNLNCYADGWMLRIRPTETPALMTAADYRSQLEG